MGKMIAKYRYRVIKQTDVRIRTLNEILQGIQTIKIYAWEIFFLNVIQKIRKCETILTLKMLHTYLIRLNFIFLKRNAGKSFNQSVVSS